MAQLSQFGTGSLAHEQARYQGLERWVAPFAALLIAASIILFLMNSTSTEVGVLISQQNEDALKLWEDVVYYDKNHIGNATSLPPGLFEQLVEFSRKNVAIVKTAHRLNLRYMLAPHSSWEDISQFIKPTDGSLSQGGKNASTDSYFDHFSINPETVSKDVVSQAMYQIRLYQAIRDFVQDEANFWKGFIGAISVYILPVAYALLGAFLYALRNPPQSAQTLDEDAHRRSGRLLMAAIAGIGVSAFGSLLSSDPALSPLLVAFIAGYAIDVFVSALDVIVHKYETFLLQKYKDTR